MSRKGNTIQIRNSTTDFLVFIKQNSEDGIEVRVHDGKIIRLNFIIWMRLFLLDIVLILFVLHSLGSGQQRFCALIRYKDI